MIRIFIIALISICFSVLKIQADCNLPTGGACNIEDLQKQKEESSKKILKNKVLLKSDENRVQKIIDEMQKDLQEQINLKKFENTDKK